MRFCGRRNIIAKFDKTRSEKEGEVAFVGTGVGTFPQIMEEQKDLRQQIQDMINEALSNVVGATPLSEPDQISNVVNVIGGGVTQSELNNAISLLWQDLAGWLRAFLTEFRRYQWNTGQRLINLQNQINNLQSGTGRDGWFQLTAASSSPMTATNASTGETGVSVAIHPDSHIDNYDSGDHVFAALLDGAWTSVNFFSNPITFVGRQLGQC